MLIFSRILIEYISYFNYQRKSGLELNMFICTNEHVENSAVKINCVMQITMDIVYKTYCSHYPQIKATVVADTPENKRLDQLTKQQSQVRCSASNCQLLTRIVVVDLSAKGCDQLLILISCYDC